MLIGCLDTSHPKVLIGCLDTPPLLRDLTNLQVAVVCTLTEAVFTGHYERCQQVQSWALKYDANPPIRLQLSSYFFVA